MCVEIRSKSVHDLASLSLHAGLTTQVALQEKVHLLDTYAVPSYDKADEYLTRCDHGHSQRVTWFELTVSMTWMQLR